MKLIKRFWRWLCRTKTRTLSLFFAATLSVAFTVTILIFSWNDKNVPDILIACVFIFAFILIIISGAIAIQSIRVGDVEIDLKSKENFDSDNI